MKDTRVLRGVPNRAFPAEVLQQYIERLGREIVTVKNGEITLKVSILKSWGNDRNGVYEFVFSGQALDYLKGTDDPRMDIVDTLFAVFEERPVARKSPGWFAGVKSPIGELSTPMACIWLACTFVGPLLTYIDSPMIVQLGKGLILMSLGYLLFGLGLQRSSQKPGVQNGPHKI